MLDLDDITRKQGTVNSLYINSLREQLLLLTFRIFFGICFSSFSSFSSESLSITMAKKTSHIRHYITSWLSIGLAEIRTRRILREKAECKQSRKSMNKNGLHWKYFKGTVRTFRIFLSQERRRACIHTVVRMVTRMQW